MRFVVWHYDWQLVADRGTSLKWLTYVLGDARRYDLMSFVERRKVKVKISVFQVTQSVTISLPVRYDKICSDNFFLDRISDWISIWSEHHDMILRLLNTCRYVSKRYDKLIMNQCALLRWDMIMIMIFHDQDGRWTTIWPRQIYLFRTTGYIDRSHLIVAQCVVWLL